MSKIQRLNDRECAAQDELRRQCRRQFGDPDPLSQPIGEYDAQTKAARDRLQRAKDALFTEAGPTRVY